LLISRGHRLEDLKDGYSIGQVQLFCRALRFNRQREVLDQAVAVSLGIRDALGKEGKLVKNWFQDLEEQNPPPAGVPAAPNNPLAHWLNRLPVVEKKRHG
jgi:hypothetical protein